ncbi:MAG: BtpA/SgcQ family protein [Hungatella hathewayi]|nr:BtpA/SgcQ family protein [Hungatella hathewayi]
MFGKEKMALGMVQLPPLPGTYLYEGQPFQEIIDYALREASSLADNGFDGFILQNFEDGPTKQLSTMEMVAYMTRVAVHLRETFPDMILGILVNWDGAASLAVAEAAGADFIRVEHVYTRGEMTTFGYIEGQCIEVCNLRKRLNSKVKVLADVYECHSVPVAPLPVREAAVETVRYAYADGLVLSAGTVDEAMEMAAQVREALPDTPLIIGGGTNGGNIRRVLQVFDGACVGAWIKDGNLKNPVNRERAREYMSQVREAERQESI